MSRFELTLNYLILNFGKCVSGRADFVNDSGSRTLKRLAVLFTRARIVVALMSLEGVVVLFCEWKTYVTLISGLKVN